MCIQGRFLTRNLVTIVDLHRISIFLSKRNGTTESGEDKASSRVQGLGTNRGTSAKPAIIPNRV